MLPTTVPFVALIVVAPAVFADAGPPAPIVATPVFVLSRITSAVRFWLVPVAQNPRRREWLRRAPVSRIGFAGETTIDVSVAPVTVRFVEPAIAFSGRADCRRARIEPLGEPGRDARDRPVRAFPRDRGGEILGVLVAEERQSPCTAACRRAPATGWQESQ